MKEKAIEACRILNEFVLDLITGVKCIELFESPAVQAKASQETNLGMTRLCFFHLIITLSKWIEFYNKYQSLLPNKNRKVCKNLKKEIEKREIGLFRNKFVGHIWDKDCDRPLTKEESDAYIVKINGGDKAAFLGRINKLNAPYPTTVVSISERVRDELEKQYSLTHRDLFPWAAEGIKVDN